MHTHPAIPSIEEVNRIVSVKDPVIRNLQITQCYHELAAVLAWRTGLAASWCTFATWASKQAGQTIRKEDLARLLESRLKGSPAAMQSAESVAATANIMGAKQIDNTQELALSARNFTSAIDRASDAVSRGNQKVFEEIGYEFARFYHACLDDQTPDDEKVSRFCEALCLGEPPEGQGYLRRAFFTTSRH
jgi:hypothetical protein